MAGTGLRGLQQNDRPGCKRYWLAALLNILGLLAVARLALAGWGHPRLDKKGGVFTASKRQQSRRKSAAADAGENRAPSREASKAVLQPAAGTAGSDQTCPADTVGNWDVAAATKRLRTTLAAAYLNETTLCEDLGPTCVSEGGHLTLFQRDLQPANGSYTHIDHKVLRVLKSLRAVMHLVGWGGPEGGNPDVWNGNIRTFDGEVLHVWPSGPGVPPPVPFSPCTRPVGLFWDFPENFWHTMAAYSAVWEAAVPGPGGGAALPPDATLALGLPFNTPVVPEYLYAPLLASVTRGAVSTLGHLGAHGAAPAATAAAAAAGEAEGGNAPARVFHSPRVRCFASFTLCSLAGYHSQPPPPMFRFLQAVKRDLLRAAAAADPALRGPAEEAEAYMGGASGVPSCAWPSGKRFVTGPDGVLRVTLAVRSEGTRRVLNTAELLEGCAGAGAMALGEVARNESVRVACSQYAFGSGGGMAGDIARMQATDVLVAVHGAGLTNLGFLRPGALVVEIRPIGFDPTNADRFYRPLARSSGCLKWWGVMMHDAYLREGSMKAGKKGNPSKWERDKDLLVPWEGLAGAISAAASLTYEEWVAKEPRAFTHVM